MELEVATGSVAAMIMLRKRVRISAIVLLWRSSRVATLVSGPDILTFLGENSGSVFVLLVLLVSVFVVVEVLTVPVPVLVLGMLSKILSSLFCLRVCMGCFCGLEGGKSGPSADEGKGDDGGGSAARAAFVVRSTSAHISSEGLGVYSLP